MVVFGNYIKYHKYIIFISDEDFSHVSHLIYDYDNQGNYSANRGAFYVKHYNINP